MLLKNKFFPLCIALVFTLGCNKKEEVIPTLFVDEQFKSETSLSQIIFRDDQTGFAIGEKGTLLKTINAGNSWSNVDLESQADLINIAFPSKDTAYITGSLYGSSVFFSSFDGGKSWNQKTFSNIELERASFPSKNIGYAIDGKTDIKKYNAEDGYWDYLNTPMGAFSPMTIFFKDEKTGWITDFDSETYYTTDGGNNWEQVFLNLSGGPRVGRTSKMSINKSGIGYAINSTGNISKTENGGETWMESRSPDNSTDYILYDISIPSNDVAYVSGSQILAVTKDRGESWTYLRKQDGTSIQQELVSIYFINESIGFAATADGTILKLKR